MRLRPLALLLFALLSCPAQAASPPPNVLATIKPIHSLVAAVMDGVAAPHLLVGGANSLHTYVLRPSDARAIARADIVFWVGPDLETFLQAPLRNLARGARIVALEHAPGMRLLAARPGGLWTAPLHTAKAGDINPHVWLDPANAIAMTRAIAATLSAADPAHAARYAANASARDRADRGTGQTNRAGARADPQAPLSRLPRCLSLFRSALRAARHRRRDGRAGPAGGAAPHRGAARRDRAGKAVCIFREPQFPPALIRTLAAGTGCGIGVLDPLGADLKPGPALYPALMRGMADALHHLSRRADEFALKRPRLPRRPGLWSGRDLIRTGLGSFNLQPRTK